MRGPLQAVSLALAFALTGLLFAPSLVLGGAVIGLVALHQGLYEVLKVAALAALLAALALLIGLGSGAPGLVVLLPWVPVCWAARVLDTSGSQGRALASLGLFVGGFALAIRRSVPAVDAFWRERLTQLAASVKTQGSEFLGPDEIAAVASVMQEAAVGVTLLGLSAMLMTARWWQAELYKPGAFGEEFRQLVLPFWVVPLSGVVALAAVLGSPDTPGAGFAGDCLVVLVLLFAAQGLSVAHERVLVLGAPRAWLVGLYLCASLLPHVAATGLAATGMADFVADFRRLRQRAGPK
ncbi:MAG: hypothetical protein EXR83_10355 [Gammaproteobacteria bacterium]|nr:hypothetical protein [Gammaproteobacteria bacterium]